MLKPSSCYASICESSFPKTCFLVSFLFDGRQIGKAGEGGYPLTRVRDCLQNLREGLPFSRIDSFWCDRELKLH